MSHIFAYSKGKGIFFNERIEFMDKHAFSGDIAHANNEEYMNLKTIGPIPVGTYTIKSLYNHMGELEPSDVEDEYVREQIYIHSGHNISDHSSKGCIIVGQKVLENLQSGDTITVTNEL
jgi:hypothetical protein